MSARDTLHAKNVPVRSSRFMMIAAILLGTAIPSRAQIPATPTTPLAFEVASIRLVAPYTEDEIEQGKGNTPWSGCPANRFTARRLTLKLLIAISYGVQDKYIQGGPSWLDEQHYDIEAQIDGDKQFTCKERQQLLQHLLEQRFHLGVHTKTAPVSGFALVVAKGGAKLNPGTGGDGSHNYILPNRLHAQGVNMGTIASLFSSAAGQPVIDKTGISGTYNVDLKYAPDSATDSSLPSLFTALQEQLGLKLESQKVPVETLVVDHAEKVPTEN